MGFFGFGKKPGDTVIFCDGEEGTVTEEVYGNRLVVERIGNLSKKPIEVVVKKSKVRKKR